MQLTPFCDKQTDKLDVAFVLFVLWADIPRSYKISDVINSKIN